MARRRLCDSVSFVWLAAFLLATVGRWGIVAGQFVEDSDLFRQERAAEAEHLDDLLKNHPDLEDIHFPLKYLIPIDFYREETTTDYQMSVIFDPCRGHNFDCCDDTYGTPEWRRVITDNPELFGQDLLLHDDGTELNSEASRRPTDEQVIDEDCDEQYGPNILCKGERVRRQDFSVTPLCWNHNETVLAGVPCRSPRDGSPVESCLEVGITQTAYIVECGGKFQDDPHCGTFLEIHRPGDNTILAETKLRGQFTSGYRMTLISTTHRGNASRVLCEGKHEIWWVMRTKYDWVIQRKLPFTIISPRCDWDGVNDRYRDYATAASAEVLAGLDPYDPDRFLFSRVASTGTRSLPGKGMGSTIVLPTADNPASEGRGELPGINDLLYEPEPASRPTIPEFEAAYPQVPLDDAGLPEV